MNKKSKVHIDKESVDLSKNCVVHFFKIIQISLDLVQISINRSHFPSHIVLNIENGKNYLDCHVKKYQNI